MVPVLFCQERSIYKKLGCDVYDEQRNALTWAGGRAAIYHPPCRTWSKMSSFSTAPESEKKLGLWAVSKARLYGGIVEHPLGTKLFSACNIEHKPGIDKYGGFLFRINQFDFGHKASKPTLLYIVGISPRDLPSEHLRFEAVQYVVSTTSKNSNKKELSKYLRNATPILFARWLIHICERIQYNLHDRYNCSLH